MEKEKSYRNVRFGAEVIKNALEQFYNELPRKKNWRTVFEIRNITRDGETWEINSNEDFLAAYRKISDEAHLTLTYDTSSWWSDSRYVKFSFNCSTKNCRVSVDLPKTFQVESVFEIFESNLESSKLPLPVKEIEAPCIFIGHGRSLQWRDLKDHLTDKHGYQVVAYEVGARAGHTIRDILDEMLAESSFALLVMTAEDETGDGQIRARQNVVHELGLFQGRLGFARAIVVVENGVELFSNISGVQQLRFATGKIAEVYGDVLATLYREFGDAR